MLRLRLFGYCLVVSCVVAACIEANLDYDSDDDEPTLVDSSGVEYGFCIKGERTVPLSALTWDGVCRDCKDCDDQ